MDSQDRRRFGQVVAGQAERVQGASPVLLELRRPGRFLRIGEGGEAADARRQVFRIYLRRLWKDRPNPASGEMDSTFSRHLRRVRDTCENVWFGELRILFQDFGDRHTRGQVIEYQGNPDAMAPDARLAATDRGIYRDAIEQFPVRHGSSSVVFHP